MKIEWITTRISIEDAEARHMVVDDRRGPEPIPFGYCNAAWESLKSQMQPEDELWEFKSPPETWEQTRGRKGITLVRGREIVASVLSLMN